MQTILIATRGLYLTSMEFNSPNYLISPIHLIYFQKLKVFHNIPHNVFIHTSNNPPPPHSQFLLLCVELFKSSSYILICDIGDAKESFDVQITFVSADSFVGNKILDFYQKKNT